MLVALGLDADGLVTCPPARQQRGTVVRLSWLCPESNRDRVSRSSTMCVMRSLSLRMTSRNFLTDVLAGRSRRFYQGLGIAADVGDGSASARERRWPRTLSAASSFFTLLGDIVDHDQDAPPAFPGRRGPLRSCRMRSPRTISLSRQSWSRVRIFSRGAMSPKSCLIGDAAPHGDGHVQHLLGGGVGVDDRAVPVEGHHAVGHVQEEGV